MTSIFDFEPVFHGNVPQAVYDYTAHGADSEFTIRRNRDAFDWVDVVPRAPIDSATVDTRTTVLGLNLDESRAMLDRVHGAGCQAIVVTVEQQATFYERTQHLRKPGRQPAHAPGATACQAASPGRTPQPLRLGPR